MAGEPNMTICGNLAGEAKLRYTPQGKAVIDFSVAQTPREKDRQSDNWVDGETQWYRVTAFGKDAENLAESLTKGVRVIATGRFKIEKWKGQDGVEKTSMKILADEVGISTKWAVVSSKKAERSSAAPATKPTDDPWAAAPTDDDIPF